LRRWHGLRRGLARTRRYLLAHHPPDERDRCHAVGVGDRPVYLCARCSGVYPGIAAGVALFATKTAPALWPWLVLLPAPALVDWAATATGDRRGHNAVRTGTGTLLGLAYGLALPWFLADFRPWLLGVAAGYGGLAAAGLWITRTPR